MILKRTEEGNLVKIIHESSTVLSSTYDRASSQLTIVFKNGGQYVYENVKKLDYANFEMAESVGKAFNQYIKPYPFTKIGNANVTEILLEAEREKDLAVRSMAELVVKQMRSITNFFDEYGVLEEHQMTDLFNIINKYGDVKNPKKNPEVK